MDEKRYVECETTLKIIDKYAKTVDESGAVVVKEIKDIVEIICPAADVVEVRHGEWIAHDDDWCGTYYTCSACGCDWTTIDGTPQENNMKYCPECGSKMGGERNDIP